MFFHERLGIITTHTREEFDRLQRGEAFGVLSYTNADRLVQHLEAGKSWQTFPNCAVTRELAGFVLAHHRSKYLNVVCPACGDNINPTDSWHLCYEEVTGIYRTHVDCKGRWDNEIEFIPEHGIEVVEHPGVGVVS